MAQDWRPRLDRRSVESGRSGRSVSDAIGKGLSSWRSLGLPPMFSSGWIMAHCVHNLETMWRTFLIVLVVNTVDSINRPAYKIVLTQRGFTQFLQYEVDTPPIREFTLCAWIRIFQFSGDQTIFTYMVNGNNRVIRLWLDTSGPLINVSINGRVSSSTAVDITRDTWHHVCLSYQSDFGAWALYIDGRLASCEAAQSLHGFVLPGGGRFILGYGTSETGNPNGLEGEVFGVNILLASTIERNYTMKKIPQYQQKTFLKNKLTDSTNDNIKYVVLGQQLTSQTSENFETRPVFVKSNRSFIKFKSPFSQFEHDIGVELNAKTTKIGIANETEILDLPNYNRNYKNKNYINIWDFGNKDTSSQNDGNKRFEPFSTSTKAIPNVSEFETPPPETGEDYSFSKFKIKKSPIKFLFQTDGLKNMISSNRNIVRTYMQNIPDIEMPPPVEKKEKVYGQWTTSSFANDVLNYLKSVNGNYKEQTRVPATIPLLKISDNFPYSSEMKVTKIFAPHKFQRRTFQDVHQIRKRENKHPEINVEILEDNLRTQILEEHAKTYPQNIEIKSRGRNKIDKDHRFYRNAESRSSEDQSNSNENQKSVQFISKPKIKIRNRQRHFDQYNSFMNILPFLKPKEHYNNDGDNYESIENNKMYTKSLSNANKWHNVKSYSNDFGPREINIESSETHNSMEHRIAEANKKQPSIRLKYRPEYKKVVKNYDDVAMIEGRTLATEISNLSSPDSNIVPILKYNHGFLPSHNQGTKPIGFISKRGEDKNSFDQHIKIGNALNERDIIGESGEDNKRSFIGGNEKIPDINRYRSDIDNTKEYVPPSLGPKVCKNVELFDRLLYVQPDGSVDGTQILSPVKEKNVGIEFVIQNYRKCSLQESDLQRNPLLLIDWSKTPVRLFGGAYPKKTTDLCGFF